MSASVPFIFRPGELSNQLDRGLTSRQTGYWHIQLESTSSAPARDWYLTCVVGRITYSGSKPLGWDAFIQTLQRFVPQLNEPAKQAALRDFERHATEQQRNFLSLTVNRMAAQGILPRAEIERAMKLATLCDLDVCLLDRSGRGEFTEDYQFMTRSPITGFEWGALKSTSQQRHLQWQRITPHVPSMEAVPVLNIEAVAQRALSEVQRQQLQSLTERRESLATVARRLAADPLKVAATFAPLVQQGLVSLSLNRASSAAAPTARSSTPAVAARPVAARPIAAPSPVTSRSPNRQVQSPAPAVRPPQPSSASTVTPAPQQARRSQGKPEVFVVDDSPLILRQFQTLVSSLGYQPVTCDNALSAVQTMLNHRPVTIFLDINMPGASGFELIKQIRRQPQLADIPVVIMTAEQSQSNQKRAQWAKCTFLEKPLSAADISGFCARLHDILQQVAPSVSSSPR
ncbi:MAG: response regulator [Cyanobacteria bacterium J06642_2]